jgi:hypothetical protein
MLRTHAPRPPPLSHSTGPRRLRPPSSIRPFLKLVKGLPAADVASALSTCETGGDTVGGGEAALGKEAEGTDGAGWLNMSMKDAALTARAHSGGAAWTQTPESLVTAGEKQAAALRAMLNRLADYGGSTSEALALARRAAEPPPPLSAEREKFSRKEVLDLKRAALLDAPLGGGKSTAALASLWFDGSLRASQVKQERAELAQWRAKRARWTRASGLRKQLVLAIADSEAHREAKRSNQTRMRTARMALWKVEDAAATTIQDAWRDRRRWRVQREQMNVALRLRMARKASRIAGAEHTRLVKLSRTAGSRKRARVARKSGLLSGTIGTAAEQAEAIEQAQRETEERVAWTEGLELSEVSDSVEKQLAPLLEKLKAKAAALLAADTDADTAQMDDGAVALGVPVE